MKTTPWGPAAIEWAEKKFKEWEKKGAKKTRAEVLLVGLILNKVEFPYEISPYTMSVDELLEFVKKEIEE
ncbi:MAG: hypothetical protein NTY81_03170 [Candidatus Staskawiczbacteria bacterium]|nr:hypothetical protein [Candidatus Staskawiczbacteria bacterium]